MAEIFFVSLVYDVCVQCARMAEKGRVRCRFGERFIPPLDAAAEIDPPVARKIFSTFGSD